METEGIAASLRLRSAWEAVDLGFRMVAAWWKPIYRLWLLTVLPFAALVIAALGNYPAIALVVIWWFKPLYDRIVLHVISDGLFGEVPPLRESLGSWRTLGGGVWRSLLLARFSPTRGVSIPVHMLERLQGRSHRERCHVLLGREVRVPAGLLYICSGFELALCAGLDSLFSSIPYAQKSINLETLLLAGPDYEFGVGALVAYVAVISIIEPFFVGGCFGFYINRRVYLEGWDIDLAFRRLAERCRKLAAAALVLVVAACVSLLATASPVQAQLFGERVECEADAAQAAPCIEQILATDEFKTYTEQSFPAPSGDLPEFLQGLLSFLGSIFVALTQLSGVFLVLLVILIFAAIVYSLRNRAPRAQRTPEPNLPQHRFGLDLRPESLPTDVVADARALFAAGDAAGALSLLYRASLVYVIRSLGVEIAESATEGECVRLVRAGAHGTVSDSFGRLTRAWLYCAYAHTPPGAEEFQELCELWSPILRAEP